MTKIIGLTGGIGSGKSTVASYFQELGVPVYIADTEAKKIMEEAETIEQVQKLFEENVIVEGKLDRKKIASIVFNNPEKLEQLNQVIHPRVKQDFKNWLKKHQQHRFVIKEVAILFETGSEKEFDAIILVTAPEKIRIERVMQRDKVTEAQVMERIKNQLSDQEKINKSSFIIKNLLKKDTKKQVKELIILLNKI
ncbi:MAG: dephospho-CoA kinase [Flavobacteriaceae bacterium]